MSAALSSPTDARLLLMSPDDNCLIAATALQAGETVTISGQAVTLPESVALGHKVARHALAAGVPVLRYGAVIGTTTTGVAIGAHLHLHNLRSNYIETHALERPAAGQAAKGVTP